MSVGAAGLSVVIAMFLLGAAPGAIGAVIPGVQQELEDQSGLPETARLSLIKVQVVESSTALVIDGAVAFLVRGGRQPEGLLGSGLRVHDEAAQPIVASEFRFVMLNAFGERLCEYVANMDTTVPSVDKRQAPKDWKPTATGFRQVTVSDLPGRSSR